MAGNSPQLKKNRTIPSRAFGTVVASILLKFSPNIFALQLLSLIMLSHSHILLAFVEMCVVLFVTFHKQIDSLILLAPLVSRQTTGNLMNFHLGHAC